MTDIIKKLPNVFQTPVEKKFFQATFDQVFSKKDSNYLYGYVGQRIPSRYDPIKDFYLPAPDKDRTWWQLEATAFTRNLDFTKTDITFYDDLLDNINYYGGNTLNQDRLFTSEYYSWAPPIDYDMFINYQEYYWVESGLGVINLYNILYTDIIGNNSVKIPAYGDLPEFYLSSGMHVKLIDDPVYKDVYVVENIGSRMYPSSSVLTSGIRLSPMYSNFLQTNDIIYLSWDCEMSLEYGVIVDNSYWDTLPWEATTKIAKNSNADYITIERSSTDRNSWSRTNKWVHIDVIKSTTALVKSLFPVKAVRAKRPIIQFDADIILYNSGITFLTEITYGIRYDLNGVIAFKELIDGKSISDITSLLGIALNDGDLIAFFIKYSTPLDDPTIGADTMHWDIWPEPNIWRVFINEDTTVMLTLEYTVKSGDIVYITKSSGDTKEHTKVGDTWFYNGEDWEEAANQKIKSNQSPMFMLYDHANVPLDDTSKYPNSNFTGSPIFSYKENTTAGATVDPVLGFAIVYTSLAQASDIVFKNNLITDRYTYKLADILPIDGYYYYLQNDIPIYHNTWELHNPCNSSYDGNVPWDTFEMDITNWEYILMP